MPFQMIAAQKLLIENADCIQEKIAQVQRDGERTEQSETREWIEVMTRRVCEVINGLDE